MCIDTCLSCSPAGELLTHGEDQWRNGQGRGSLHWATSKRDSQVFVCTRTFFLCSQIAYIINTSYRWNGTATIMYQ